MIEPNSGGSELSREAQAHIALWECEMQRVQTAEKIGHAVGYIATSVTFAVQDVKEWVHQNEFVRRTGTAIFAAMANLGRTMNPGLYLAAREQNRQDDQA